MSKFKGYWLWFVLLLIVSNLLVFYFTADTFKNDVLVAEPNPRIQTIYKELSAETITSKDEQSAYDQVVTFPNKSFVYDINDTVYILNNGEVFRYTVEDPLDTNKYYQDIINKFIELNKYDRPISKEDIVSVGFMPEVINYGFKNIYTDFQEDYKALIKNYIYQRKSIELEILKYINNESTLEKIEDYYEKYSSSKEMLNNYIIDYTPGDL